MWEMELCRLRRGSCGTISPVVASPFVKRGEEVLDGFVFRPEVAQKFARIARENGALFGDEFLDGRVTFPRVFVRYGLMPGLILHGCAPNTPSPPSPVSVCSTPGSGCQLGTWRV